MGADYIQAAATFAANISDPKTHAVPAVVPGQSVMASVILFYDSDTVSYPDIFKPFTDIPAVSNTLAFKTLSELATETAVQVIPDIKYVLSRPVPSRPYSTSLLIMSINQTNH